MIKRDVANIRLFRYKDGIEILTISHDHGFPAYLVVNPLRIRITFQSKAPFSPVALLTK